MVGNLSEGGFVAVAGGVAVAVLFSWCYYLHMSRDLVVWRVQEEEEKEKKKS